MAAARIHRLQLAELLVQLTKVTQPRNAEIDAGGGVGGNDVGASAAA